MGSPKTLRLVRKFKKGVDVKTQCQPDVKLQRGKSVEFCLEMKIRLMPTHVGLMSNYNFVQTNFGWKLKLDSKTATLDFDVNLIFISNQNSTSRVQSLSDVRVTSGACWVCRAYVFSADPLKNCLFYDCS